MRNDSCIEESFAILSTPFGILSSTPFGILSSTPFGILSSTPFGMSAPFGILSSTPEELTEPNSLRMLLLLPVASSEEQYHRLTLSGTYSLNWLYNSQMFFVTHYPIHAIFSHCSISLSYITGSHTRDIQNK